MRWLFKKRGYGYTSTTLVIRTVNGWFISKTVINTSSDGGSATHSIHVEDYEHDILPQDFKGLEEELVSE